MKRNALLLCTVFLTTTLFAQVRIYRQLPSDASIGFGLSNKYNVEVKDCNGSYQSVYTYGIEPNDPGQVTTKEHLAMFGFDPTNGPVSIKITLQSGTNLTSSNIGLRNKTYKGVTTSFSGGAMYIDVCEPMKQLMVRMPGDLGNPLMIHVDPFDDPAIPQGANVVTFGGGTNGLIHEQTEEWDRYTAPNNVDVVVIEDGALFKGTIHVESDRTTPLTVQGRGMVICRYVEKPANDVKMKYNAMELNKGNFHKIYGVTLVNGRHFAIRVSDDAHIQNVKLYGYRPNNDGIVAGDRSVIENSFFKCNDDHIKLYSPYMEVRNCVFYEQSNGAVFQFAWNNLDPGDECIIENIEVLEWEAGCGDPDLGQGGVARSFINHRESESTGKICANTTFKNVYIQGQLARFICLNGLVQPITYTNLKLENITLENVPNTYNWIYANAADDNTTSIEITFKNVRFGSRFIQASDFKTKGTCNFTFDNTGSKYTGYMNPSEVSSCACSGGSPIAVPGTVEAEDYANMSGIQTETTSDAGGGLNVGWTDAGDWMDYNVDVATAGTYDVEFRVAANTQSIKGELKSGSTVLATLNEPATGGWQTWTTVTKSVTLSAGVQTLRLAVTGNGWNINWMKFTATSGGNEFNDITDLTATVNSCNQIVLNWTDNSTGESGYRVRRKISGEPTYTTLGDVAANGETYTDNAAAGNTTYIYQVRALDNGVAVKASNLPQATTPSCAVDVDLHIEAEDFTAQSGIQTETTSDAGGGLNIGWINHNDWAEYSVNIPQAGTYSMTFRVAGNKSADIVVESNSTQVGTASVTATGGWQNWTTVGPISVALPAGQQTIRLTFENASVSTSLVNLNWIEIYTPGLKSAENEMAVDLLSEVSVYPNPTNGILNIDLNSDADAAYRLMNLSGVMVHAGQVLNGSETLDVTSLSAGVYILQLSTGASIHQQQVVVK